MPSTTVSQFIHDCAMLSYDIWQAGIHGGLDGLMRQADAMAERADTIDPPSANLIRRSVKDAKERQAA